MQYGFPHLRAAGYSARDPEGGQALRRTLRERITARVLLLSATVAVLLGTALGLLIVTVAGQRDAAREAFRSQEALTTATRLQGSLVRIENGVRGFAASGRERFLEPAEEALERYPRQLRRLDGLVAEAPLQRRTLADLEAHIEDYVNLWARPLIGLARDEPASARSVLVTNGGRERLQEIDGALEELAALKRGVVRDNAQRADRASTLAIGFGVSGLGLVLAVAAGVALYLGRAVVGPVRAVARATGRLAGGDLSTRVPAEREDELGDLARSFNEMADRLQVNRAELASRTEQLEHSNAELTRSNRELEQFASVTSHDLQAPLVTVTMYAELLERRHGALLGEDLELVEGIRGATGQARELIRDLLDYSRAGREQPSLEAVRADTVVEQALESLAGAIETAGARVRVEGSLPVVLADAADLARRGGEPGGQRGEVRRRRRAGGDHRRPARRRLVAPVDTRQRHRHGPRPCRADLRALPTPQRRGALPGHRHRAGDLRAHRGAPRRAHLGGQRPGRGQHLLVHPPARAGRRRVDPLAHGDGRAGEGAPLGPPVAVRACRARRAGAGRLRR